MFKTIEVKKNNALKIIKVKKNKALIKGLDQDLEDVVIQFFNFSMDSKQINPLIAKPSCHSDLIALMTFIHKCALLCHLEVNRTTYSTRARTVLAILLKKPITSIPLEPERPLPQVSKNYTKIKNEILSHIDLYNKLISPPGSSSEHYTHSVQHKNTLLELLKKRQSSDKRFRESPDNLEIVIDYMRDELNFQDYASEHSPEFAERGEYKSVVFFNTITNIALALICTQPITSEQTQTLQKTILHSTTMTLLYLEKTPVCDHNIDISIIEQLDHYINLFQLKNLDEELLAKQNQVFETFSKLTDYAHKARVLCSIYKERQNPSDTKPILTTDLQNAVAMHTIIKQNEFCNFFKTAKNELDSKIEQELERMREKKKEEKQSAEQKQDIKVIFTANNTDISSVISNVIKDIITDRQASSSNEAPPIVKESAPISKDIKSQAKTLFQPPKPPRQTKQPSKKKTAHPIIVEEKPLIESTEASSEPIVNESLKPTLMSLDAFMLELNDRADKLNRALSAVYHYQQLSINLQQAEHIISSTISTVPDLNKHLFHAELDEYTQDTQQLIPRFFKEKTTPLLIKLNHHFQEEYNNFYLWIKQLINAPVPPKDTSLPYLIDSYWTDCYQKSYANFLLKQSIGITNETPAHYVALPAKIKEAWPQENHCYLSGTGLWLMICQQPIRTKETYYFFQIGENEWKENHFEHSGFTINALFCDRTGRIIDPTGYGYDDLQNKRLRPIGNPNIQFAKKPECILQVIDCLRKGFLVEPEILQALQDWNPESQVVADDLNQKINAILSLPQNTEHFRNLLDEYNIITKIQSNLSPAFKS